MNKDINKILKHLAKTLIKGGSSSGNFGHTGRPGEVGGSGSGGGSNGEGIDEDNYSKLGKQVKKSKFTDSEKKSLRYYSGWGGEEINNQLRKEKLSNFEKNIVDNLDSSINKNKLDKEIIVHRVINSDFYNSIKDENSFLDKGFLSTSADKDSLATYLEHNTALYGDVKIINIKVPKGTNFITPGHIIFGSSFDESEVLFGRNQKLNKINDGEYEIKN